MSSVFTIGHSAHGFDLFARLLTQHCVEVLVDVRSAPYSKYAPQFDREILQPALNQVGIKYLFLGAELGGRPRNEIYYDARGRVLYSRIITDPAFVTGI